jgi:AraC family transcriptional regulator of adaptative response / DNA-3-methyladenine glycosylase II
LQLDDLRDLTLAVQRCRRLLDLDADPQAIIDQLGRDPALRRALRRDPGRRLPGSADPHEAAVRAVVGQQVSVASARALLGRLVRSFGKPLAAPNGGLTHLFPDAATLAGADPAALALPRSRALALIGLARAIADGDVVLDAGSDAEEVRQQLPLLAGIGSWTADYIALRALGHPDVFVHGDLGARRAAEQAGLPTTFAALAAAAMRWRPWRSYALIHLWSLNEPTERQS